MVALIIGINSFLGLHLTRLLLKNKWVVDGIYHQQRNLVPKGCRQLYDFSAWERLSRNYSHVFVLSTFVPHGSLDVADTRFQTINVELVRRASARFENSRLIHSSTVAIYGDPKGVITESTPPNNPDLYAQSKSAGEALVKNHPSYGVIRFSTLFGKGMDSSSFLPQLIRQAQIAQQVELSAKGARLENYLPVSAAAEYCLRLAALKSNATLLGVGERSHSDLEVAQMVTHHLPQTEIRYREEDLGPSWNFDASKTTELLKWTPRFDLREEIKPLLAPGAQ